MRPLSLVFSAALLGLVACGGDDSTLFDDAGADDSGAEGDTRATFPDGAAGSIDGAHPLPGTDGAIDAPVDTTDGSTATDAGGADDATADRNEPPPDAMPGPDASDAAAPPPPPVDASAPDAATLHDAGPAPVDASIPDAAVPVDASLPLPDAALPDSGPADAATPVDASVPDTGAADSSVPPPPVDAGSPDAAPPCVIPASAYTAPDPAVDPGPAETPPFGDEVRLLSLTANAIVYDPHSRHLFASTPSTVGARGNSIVTIDPMSAAILGITYVGSEPTSLALSRDGQFLYTNLRGANAIRRFDIATATASLQFTLGLDPQGAPWNAIDLQVLPQSPHSVLVSSPQAPYSYAGSLAVFDDGVPRPVKAEGYNSYPSYYAPSLLVTSNSDALAFGMDALSGALVELCIDARGVQPAATHTGFLGSVAQIAYSAPSIYTNNGNVFDVATGNFLGTYAVRQYSVPTGLAVDTPANRTYVLSGSYNAPGLTAFDQTHFTPTGTVDAPPLPSTTNGAAHLVRWGRYGLAFLTSDGQIALVRSPIVAQR